MQAHPMTHDEIVRAAARWLRKQRYPVVLEDVRTTATNEQPDVIGWKNRGGSFLLECKASLRDYRDDALKSFRRDPERGMGRLRAYVVPESIAHAVVEDVVHRGPSVGRWGVYSIEHGRKQPRVRLQPEPFLDYAKHEETCLLVSAVRRVTEGWGRRMLGPDAPMNPNGDPHPTASKIIRELQRENTNLRRRLERRET